MSKPKKKNKKLDDLKVKIIEKGIDSIKPKIGDTVTIMYTTYYYGGKQKNTKIDESESKTFTLGKGQSFDGIEQGLTMITLGTKATFKIPNNLCFGYDTFSNNIEIPYNQNIKIELQLIQINDKIRTIKPYKSGEINVIILNKSSKAKTKSPNKSATNNNNDIKEDKTNIDDNNEAIFPTKKDVVSILYIGRYHGGPKHGIIFDKNVDKNKPFIFEIDKKNKNDKKKLSVIKGLNDGIKQLSINNKAIIQIPFDLGYGERHPTDKNFPKKQDLTFEVELLNIQKGKK